jgi:type IV pilus assembly protein PilE
MKATKGFTLVELLVVVAIVGILAAVAIPYYNDYVIRGKLAEGMAALGDGRIKMEQFFQDNRTYVGGPTPADTTYFTYDNGTPTASTYTLRATGRAGANGFIYTLDQNNQKQTTAAPSGWQAAAMPANCWIVRKNGGC